MSSIAITHLTPIIIHLTADQYHKNGGYYAGMICKSPIIISTVVTSKDGISDMSPVPFPHIYHHIPHGGPGGLSRLLHGHGGPALPNPLTLPQALSFGLDVARGVQYLHSHLVGNPPKKKTDELKLETKKQKSRFFLWFF